jgi:DmsE family decaheme c-type cytochrome
MKAKSPELCYTCHMDIRAQFARPFHHRLNEGLIQCNDCHSPHGTFRPKQLRTNASGDEVCYKCHSEKQGPFVYQHEAKVEGCVVCHSPHGSTNQRMLNQNQVNRNTGPDVRGGTITDITRIRMVRTRICMHREISTPT